MNKFFSKNKLFIFLFISLFISSRGYSQQTEEAREILIAPITTSVNDVPNHLETEGSPSEIETDDITLESSGKSKKVDEPFDEAKFNFEDMSSWNLSVSGWENLAERNYEGVYAFTNKCLATYEEQADLMAKEVNRFPGMGHEDDYALMNDVAACYYILGEAYMRQEQYDKAITMFETAIEKYPYAMCWDPKGWFWKVRDIAKINIEKCQKAKETMEGEKVS